MLLCPWDFPGKNTEVGCHFFLQGIFPTQRWKLCLLHWQADSLPLSHQFSSVQFSHSVVSDSLRPMNRSTPGLPVHHQLLEFTQTHVHRVGDAIQISHPLSFPSPPAPNPSQHQGLFEWINSLHEAKDWSFSFIISPSNEYPGLISFRMDFRMNWWFFGTQLSL